MEIKITIEGLSQLTEAVALLGSAMAYKQDMIKTAVAAEGVAEGVKEAVTKSTEKVTKPEEKITKPEEKLTKLTIEDVREAFLAKNSKANAPKLKALLKEFGVAKVTDLEEKDFEAVLKALEGI